MSLRIYKNVFHGFFLKIPNAAIGRLPDAAFHLPSVRFERIGPSSHVQHGTAQYSQSQLTEWVPNVFSCPGTELPSSCTEPQSKCKTLDDSTLNKTHRSSS